MGVEFGVVGGDSHFEAPFVVSPSLWTAQGASDSRTNLSYVSNAETTTTERPCFRIATGSVLTGFMTADCVRREKAALSSGCESHPANAPAGSNRSSHGGDEMAEAFGIARHI